MGLSGGKDSRLLAAALVSEGIVPRFVTNEENPREGETARHLSHLLAQHRGIDVDHHFYVATEPDLVHEHGVVERAHRLHRRPRLLVPLDYLNRPVEPAAEHRFPAPSLVGVCGEYLSDYWLPEEWKADPSAATAAEAHSTLRRHLSAAGPRKLLTSTALAHLDQMIDDRFARAQDHGLDPFGSVSYGYMTGQDPEGFDVTHEPSPDHAAGRAGDDQGSVRAVAQGEGTTLSAQRCHQQRSFLSGHRCRSLAPEPAVREDEMFRVWHGNGHERTAGTRLPAPVGPITQLLEMDRVTRALKRAEKGTGTGRDDATLRQFAMAAVADAEFERRQIRRQSRLASRPSPSRSRSGSSAATDWSDRSGRYPTGGSVTVPPDAADSSTASATSTVRSPCRSVTIPAPPPRIASRNRSCSTSSGSRLSSA